MKQKDRVKNKRRKLHRNKIQENDIVVQEAACQPEDASYLKTANQQNELALSCDAFSSKPAKGSTLKKIGSAVLVLALAANIVGLANYKEPVVTSEDLTPSYVVEECIEMPPSPDVVLPSDDDEKQKNTTRMSISGILSYIAAWVLGTIAQLFPKLLAAIATPLGSKILGYLIFAAGVFIALAIALKKAFPNTPLKELLKGKRIVWLLILTALIIAVCEIAGYYLKEMILFVKLAGLVLGLILIIISYRKIRDRFHLA